MKKFILLISIVFFIFIFQVIINIGDDPLAQRGCCKERNSLSTNNWRENGLSFRRCRDLNSQRDNDDLYIPRGYVYWDEGC
jgi:hypothetical protein